MENVVLSFREIEKKFEKYLFEDRNDFLEKKYKIAPSDLNDKLLSERFNSTVNRLMQIKAKFNEIGQELEKKDTSSIYKCYLLEAENHLDERLLCNNFLNNFMAVIEILLECLVIENAYHLNNYSSVSKIAGPKAKVKDFIDKVTEILTWCLNFLNKNAPRNCQHFFELKQRNDILFNMISQIRVFGYLLRAYFKYLSVNMDSDYAKNMDGYDYILNDCNKVLNILERDFDISEIIFEENENELKRKYEKKEVKWHFFAHMAANVIKGHIYYEMKNISRALDAFCHSMRFYDKISFFLLKGTKKVPQDISRAKLVIGKIYGEKGLLLDSLVCYLESLNGFLSLIELNSEISNVVKRINEEIGNIATEKHNDIIDKDKIKRVLENVAISRLSKIVSPDWVKGYISDILCRAGYIFYILLWSNGGKVNDRIKSWYETARELNPTNLIATQNLSLLPGSKISDSDLPKILMSPDTEVSRKINLLSLFSLNLDEAVVGQDQEKKGKEVEDKATIGAIEKSDDEENERDLKLKRKILRSLLTNLQNIVTVPQRFNKQLILRRKIDGEGINKFLVLRRWNSFTPVIPRPLDFNRGDGGTHSYSNNKCPGGGYFLIWNKKGIVIDPGFDFIRNLYSVGYSIADIDAIFITHAHIDHMNDFFSILTLLYERKDLLDTLYGKKSPKNDFRKIDIFLNVGSLNSFLPWFSAQTEDTIRHIHSLPRSSSLGSDDNFVLDLVNSDYKMKVEVVKADHKEIISKNWAIGLKFFLPLPQGNIKDGEDVSTNNASDNYICIGITSDTSSQSSIINNYGDCDILSGHLGDINYKELKLFSELEIYKVEKLVKKISDSCNRHDIENLRELAASLGVMGKELQNANTVQRILKLILKEDKNYRLPNHLGFKGIFDLVKNLANNGKKSQKLFILSEFPEYFGSFRKRIADHLNTYLNSNKVCFTGDINLQIKIDPVADGKSRFKILCNRCANDNDIEIENKFHSVQNIQETCVKASDECMVYYCKDHKINPMKYFINKITY